MRTTSPVARRDAAATLRYLRRLAYLADIRIKVTVEKEDEDVHIMVGSGYGIGINRFEGQTSTPEYVVFKEETLYGVRYRMDGSGEDDVTDIVELAVRHTPLTAAEKVLACLFRDRLTGAAEHIMQAEEDRRL